MRILSYLSEFMIPFLIFYIVLMGLTAKRNIYDDLYCLLIKHFKQAFPDYFNLDKLKEKYKKEF